MESIPFRSDLSICRVLKAAFPRYRKRDVWISIVEMHTPFGYWWDGGSCSTYYVVNGNCRLPLPVPNGPPPFCKPAGPVTLRPGMMIVTTSVFCGKTGTMHVYIHPDDVLAPSAAALAGKAVPA